MAEIVGNGSDNSVKAVQNFPKFDGSNYREWHFELDNAKMDASERALSFVKCPLKTTTNVKHEKKVLLPFRQMFIGTSTYNLQQRRTWWASFEPHRVRAELDWF